MGNKINGVRERLERGCIDEHGITWLTAKVMGQDVRDLLADHARLQGKNAELAAAVRGLLDALPSSTTHPAIAAARKAVKP